MTKEFEVKVTMTQRLSAFIEADTQEQAEQIAAETDGSYFSEIEGACSWVIDSVEPIDV